MPQVLSHFSYSEIKINEYKLYNVNPAAVLRTAVNDAYITNTRVVVQELLWCDFDLITIVTHC